MSTYTPGRLPHGVLRELAVCPLPLSGLRRSFDTGWSRDKLGDKLFHIIDALTRDGLVEPLNGVYILTREGREALTDLESDLEVCTDPPQGSVRLFGAAA